MKIFNTTEFEKLKINSINLNDFDNIKIVIPKYHPKDKDELEQIIEKRIENEGNNCDLNDIDVSNITNMSGLFYGSKFNGDISNWDVSNVTDMSCMFYVSQFNGDISNWYVSNVTDMSCMFSNSQFNGDISKWDVSNVTYMRNMFAECPLENNPPKWYKK